MHARPLGFLLPSSLTMALVLAAACTNADPSPEPAPAGSVPKAPAAATKAEAKGDTKSDTKSDAKADAKSDAKADTKADAPAAAPAPTIPALRVAATRRGAPVALVARRGKPWLSLEGEPVPLVDGTFTRLPGGSTGIGECYAAEPWRCHMAALAGDPAEPLGLWLTVIEDVDRVGPVHRVYRHDGQRWSDVTKREGVIVGYYEPLVEWQGAVIGAQQWGPDGEKELALDEDDERANAAHAARRDKALRRAKQGLVQLAGPPVELPKVPEGLELVVTATTADGTLWAVATPPHQWNEPAAHRLLAWAPGVVEPKLHTVPDLEQVVSLGIWPSDGGLLVGGCIPAAGTSDQASCTGPYLALGRGDTWERIPIDLPHGKSATREVLGAAALPDGTLWAAIGHRWMEADPVVDADPLWQRPVGGAWQPVPVPTSQAVFGEAPRGYHPGPRKEGWNAEALVWGAGAVWVTLVDTDFRTAVLTTQPGAGPATELPTADAAASARTPGPEPEEEPL